MKGFLIRAGILGILWLISFACTPAHNGIRTNYRTDDLDPDFVREFRVNSNYLYKLDPKYSVDYMVSLVRANVFSSGSTRSIGEIVLSFGLIGKEAFFDCKRFFSMLTEEERGTVQSRMAHHPFVCRNTGYTADEALASFPVALSRDINDPNTADSHWAWFGATGNTEPLKRFLDNYLYNPKACYSCIRWSYSSNARQNQDVKRYLVEYRSGKEGSDAEILLFLFPR